MIPKLRNIGVCFTFVTNYCREFGCFTMDVCFETTMRKLWSTRKRSEKNRNYAMNIPDMSYLGSWRLKKMKFAATMRSLCE